MHSIRQVMDPNWTQVCVCAIASIQVFHGCHVSNGNGSDTIAPGSIRVSEKGVIHPSGALLSGWAYDHFRVRRDTTEIIETGDAAGMPFETWRD